ncbi:hypothetical protein FJ365_03500 [Candidatus Dependentiae bacterium]|nr:hypothetical protein [Candidatus Dependentiae bacterium]
MQHLKQMLFWIMLAMGLAMQQVRADKQVGLTMTVFVHGTILPYIKLGTLHTLVRDFPSHIRGEHTIGDAMRYQGWYQYQPIADYGLRPLHDADGVAAVVHMRNQLFGSLFEKIWKHTFGASVTASYLFGWDGSLSASRRRLAAYALYQSLLRERNRLAAEHRCNPALIDIVLIAHSHGGNVSLLLAEQETKLHGGLSIEHLVLLGTPIQQETEHFVHHDIFRQVLSLYSNGDLVQVLDMVSTAGVSKRLFPVAHHNPKLKQCALELIHEKTGATHLPTHVQLWFYDVQRFKPFFLQAYSPVNPLPLVLFTPLILKLLASVPHEHLLVQMSKEGTDVHLGMRAGSQQQTIKLPCALMQPYEKHFLIS